MKNNSDLNYQIKIVNILTEEFETKLNPIIGTDSAPDVIMLEQNVTKNMLNQIGG